MAIKKKSIYVAALTVGLAGCGGGGGGGGNAGNPGQAAAQVATGTSQVNAMLANASMVNSTNLAAAEQSFAGAHANDPTNKNGNAGYAITLLALDTQRVLDLFGAGSLATLDTSTQTVLAKRLAAAQFGALGNLTPQLAVADIMPVDLKGHLTIAQIPALSKSTRAYPTSPTYADVVALLQIIQGDLGRLDAVVSSTANVPSDVNPFPLVGKDGKTVNIGTVEMLALRTSIEALESAIDVLLTYNLGFDPSSYGYNTPFSQAFATQIATGNVQPSAYLPPAPFGTLNPNGAATLASGVAMFKTAMTTANAAIAAYNARTGLGWVVNPGSVSTTAISNVQADIAGATSALNGNYAVQTSGGTTVTMQLGKWLQNPPASLTALMPTIQDSNGLVSVNAADFPDRTFGNLFTTPLPSDQFSLSSGPFYDSDTVVKVLSELAGIDNFGVGGGGGFGGSTGGSTGGGTTSTGGSTGGGTTSTGGGTTGGTTSTGGGTTEGTSTSTGGTTGGTTTSTGGSTSTGTTG